MNQDELEVMAVTLKAIARKLDVLDSRLEAVENGSHKGKKEEKMAGRLIKGRDCVDVTVTRFGNMEGERLMAQLKGLREEDNFYTYVDSFVSLVNQVELSEEDQVAMFVEGLKGDKKLIRVLNPNNLQRAISFARALTPEEDSYTDRERTNDHMRGLVQPISGSKAKQNGSGVLQLKPAQNMNKGSAPGEFPAVTVGRNSVYQPALERFTNTGIDKKGTKELCFKGDEKFALHHNWTNDKLYSLTLEQTGGEGEAIDSVTQTVEEDEAVTLSLCALQGKRPTNLSGSEAHMGSGFTYVTSGDRDHQTTEVKHVMEFPSKQSTTLWNFGTTQSKEVLIYGLTGTKRTLLARIVAHHSEVTSIGVSESEVVQKDSEGESGTIMELFVMAKKMVPSIIFMDEVNMMDETGMVRRKSGRGNGDGKVQRTMLDFQYQVDDFETFNKISTWRITDRINTWDQILLRIGQVVMNVEFPTPKEEFQLDVLKMHSRVIKLVRGIIGTLQGQGFEALYGFSPTIHIPYGRRTINNSDVRKSLSFSVHHLPVAVTWMTAGDEGTMVIDQTHLEKAIVGGSITTLYTNWDNCAILIEGGVMVHVGMGEMEEGEIREVDEQATPAEKGFTESEKDGDDADKMVAWSGVENEINGFKGFFDDENEVMAGPIMSKKELKVLPPVPYVSVKLEPHQELVLIRPVLSIVELQIVVEGCLMYNSLSEGSILWIAESRSSPGFVEEIFGPVENPFYLIHYNSKAEIPVGVKEGILVSSVPEYASYVFNHKDSLKKGYKLSGKNDEEVSEDEEFSDDEKEAECKG